MPHTSPETIPRFKATRDENLVFRCRFCTTYSLFFFSFTILRESGGVYVTDEGVVPAADEAVLDTIDEGVLDAVAEANTAAEDVGCEEEPEFDILSCGPAKMFPYYKQWK